jgi:hypothetical protein
MASGQPSLGWVVNIKSSNYNTASDSNGDCNKSKAAPKTTTSGTVGGMSGGGSKNPLSAMNRARPVFYARGG